MLASMSPLDFYALDPNKLEPFNAEAEEAILGAILLDHYPGLGIARIADFLKPEAFYIDAFRKIYRACLSLYEQGVPTDIMSVSNFLQKQGSDYFLECGGITRLAQLADRCVSGLNIDKWANIVNEKYARRNLIKTGLKIASHGSSEIGNFEEIVKWAEEEFQAITKPNQTSSEAELNKLTRQIEKLEEIEQKSPLQYKMELKKLMKRWEIKSEKEFFDIHARWLDSNSKCRSVSLDEYLQLHGAESTKWKLQGFIPETGITVLHSMGGLGKTTFLSHLGKCLISGQSWCGYSVPKPLKILWIQTDQGAKVTLRLFDKQGFFALDPSIKVRQRIIDKWGIEEYQVLKKEIISHGYDLVFIDSLSTVSSNLIYKENDQEFARPLARIRRISEELNVAFVILHHSDWQGKLRGSTAIFNSADQVWTLSRATKTEDERELDLTIQKSRFMESPAVFRLKFNSECFGWDLLGEVEKNQQGEQEINDSTARPSFRKIFNFLTENFNIGFEAEELAERLEMSYNTVRRELLHGTKRGLIESWRGTRPRSVYFVGELRDHRDHAIADHDDHAIADHDDRAIGDHDDHAIAAIADHDDHAIGDHDDHAIAAIAKPEPSAITSEPEPDVISKPEPSAITSEPEPDVISKPEPSAITAVTEPEPSAIAAVTEPEPSAIAASDQFGRRLEEHDLVKDLDTEKTGVIKKLWSQKQGSPKEPFLCWYASVHWDDGEQSRISTTFLSRTNWRPGDRAQCNGHPLTVLAVRSSVHEVLYDTGTKAVLGHFDLDPLYPKEDPKIKAAILFETIKPGDKIKILKHREHKKIVNRKALVDKTEKRGNKHLAYCTFISGEKQIVNLEAVEVLLK